MNETKYEGAIVIKPTVGIYDTPSYQYDYPTPPLIATTPSKETLYPNTSESKHTKK